MPALNPKNIAIGVLGAAVVGLGSVVAVDHLSAPAPASTTVATAAPAGLAFSPAFSHMSGFGLGQLDRSGNGKVFQKIASDIGVPMPTVIADLRKGETLAQIAGANAGKVESDLLSTVQTALTQAAGKGAITAAQESRLMADASDAVSVLMNAKLGDLSLHGTTQ